MKSKDIVNLLKNSYPWAKSIKQNKDGLWDVKIVEEFEETVLSFVQVNNKLRFVGETTYER